MLVNSLTLSRLKGNKLVRTRHSGSPLLLAAKGNEGDLKDSMFLFLAISFCFFRIAVMLSTASRFYIETQGYITGKV